MVDQRPVGAFSGSACDHGGKQCNRNAQHRLLRNDGSVFSQYIGCPSGAAAVGRNNVEIWLKARPTNTIVPGSRLARVPE
jgi:hypothetical protein